MEKMEGKRPSGEFDSFSPWAERIWNLNINNFEGF
jgi:hypothetical protein